MNEEELLKCVRVYKLECGICGNKLKSAKTLPCFHVFCRQCIYNHITKTVRKGRYRCPTCYEEHVLLEGRGAEGLSNAYLQKSLIEIAGVIEKKTFPCSSCDDGSDAIAACFDCGDFMCAKCQTAHGKIRATKTHKVVPVGELDDSKKLADFQRVRFNKCVNHESERCKLYCNNDETEVCNICTFEPKHKGHDVITLDAKLQQLKASIAKIESGIRKDTKALHEKRKMVEEAMENVRQEQKKALENVTCRVTLLIEKLKKYEKQTHETIKYLSASKLARLSETEASIRSCEQNAQRIKMLDSLPIPSAVLSAREVIHLNHKSQAHKSLNKRDEIFMEPEIKYIPSRFDGKQISATIMSAVGHVPDSINKEEAFEVWATDMNKEMRDVAINIIQRAVYDQRSAFRDANSYNYIASPVAGKMERKFGGEWNCFVCTCGHNGMAYYNRAYTKLIILIAGLVVTLYK